MQTQYSFDWVSFTIKPDKACSQPYLIYLDEVFNLLGIDDSVKASFLECDLGSHRNYDHTFSYNGITIYSVDAAMKPCRTLTDTQREKYYTYGINVEIKGSGCRYFESVSPHGKYCYQTLFLKLIGKCADGCSLNICRLDIAFDSVIRHDDADIQPLDLDVINKARNAKYDGSSDASYVSVYRTSREVSSYDTAAYYNAESGLVEPCKVHGRSIYFGSFQSDSFCRFYDKYSEQSVNRKSDLLYLRDELSKIDSWVRLEFVFKNEVAMKIVNAYCYMKHWRFLRFLLETINSYIRFTEADASRTSNCSVTEWWSDFIGTCEHSKIKVDGIRPDEFNAAFKWTMRCSNTFMAIIDNIGVDAFITAILNNSSPDAYTAKQRRIAEGPSHSDEVYRNYDIWAANRPKVSY